MLYCSLHIVYSSPFNRFKMFYLVEINDLVRLAWPVMLFFTKMAQASLYHNDLLINI